MNHPPGPPTIPVLAAVLRRDGRYLVGLRPAHKRHGGLWEFPGGKCEPGESLGAAARRELAEELGLRVTAVGAELLRVHDAGSPFEIVFTVVDAEGEPVAHEHAALRWATVAELGALPLAPSDARFAAWLRDA
ncbi:MAG: (deoxy)nucleoside triphosphate pyrophosphohydrolase [Gemmatimonadales bacterium]|nr:(deoxy)nucleoside triphosphate pyrophosphohydrolase [Gemmatimonadales bacterium]